MALVRHVWVICVWLLIVPIVLFAQEKDDIPGMYSVEGTNPHGKPYTGVVQIVPREHTFVLHWMLDTEESYGIGIVSNGLLVVAAGPPTPSGVLLSSVVAYILKTGQPMVGEWATPGTPGIYREVLTKLPASALPLERRQRHPVNPDQKPRTVERGKSASGAEPSLQPF